jgi:hypothetical protein
MYRLVTEHCAPTTTEVGSSGGTHVTRNTSYDLVIGVLSLKTKVGLTRS